jgi:Skp family chaperone for outer membrane proteins
VTKKPTVIIALAIAVLIGLYASATPADRDRWLAALWLSKGAAERVRQDTEAERKQAAAEQEQRELRRAYAELAPAGSGGLSGERTSAVLDPEQACAQWRAVQRLRQESAQSGNAERTRLDREMSARCGTH